KDRWAGAWAVLFVSSSLLFSAGAFIITPDSLVILFFALTLWQFYRALEKTAGH
ncbi:membrane protein, partial [mine drainage metagenome]